MFAFMHTAHHIIRGILTVQVVGLAGARSPLFLLAAVLRTRLRLVVVPYVLVPDL